ncbi:MAG: CBS domain-containing protein [Syntrophobacteraceae bacterium]
MSYFAKIRGTLIFITSEVITVSPDTDFLLIVDIMTRKHIRRIPVIEAGACSS